VQPREHAHRLAFERALLGLRPFEQPTAIVYGGMSDGTMPSIRRMSRKRRAEPAVVGLVREHLGDRDLGVGGDRLHHAHLQLEVVFGNTGNCWDSSGASRATKRSGGPSAGWIVNSSVSLDMPLPSGAVTSVTVAPGVRVAFHHAAMRSASQTDRCAMASRASVPRSSCVLPGR